MLFMSDYISWISLGSNDVHTIVCDRMKIKIWNKIVVYFWSDFGFRFKLVFSRIFFYIYTKNVSQINN